MILKKKEPHVDIQKHEEYGDYLLKEAVSNVGTVDLLDHERVVTRDGTAYFVYKMMYLTPNGIDSTIDDQNHFEMVQVLNNLEHDFGIRYVNEIKSNLNENIEFFKRRLEEPISENLKEKIKIRIEVMEIFNDEKYVSLFLLIDTRDNDIFCRTSNNVISIEKYRGKKLIEFLRLLNNELD